MNINMISLLVSLIGIATLNLIIFIMYLNKRDYSVSKQTRYHIGHGSINTRTIARSSCKIYVYILTLSDYDTPL